MGRVTVNDQLLQCVDAGIGAGRSLHGMDATNQVECVND